MYLSVCVCERGGCVVPPISFAINNAIQYTQHKLIVVQAWLPATVSKDVLLRNRGREGPK